MFKLILNKLKTSQKEWLIDYKKDDGFTALHLACLNNFNSIVSLLVSSELVIDLNSTNSNMQTPLHLAVERLNHYIVNLLLTPTNNSMTSTCDPNRQDKEGNTPLHYLLKNFSLNRFKKDNETETEKDKTIIKRTWEPVDDDLSTKIAGLLIDFGANIYAKNKHQQTPIDLCSDPDFIKFLIKRFRLIQIAGLFFLFECVR